jgi:hypothetical protein
MIYLLLNWVSQLSCRIGVSLSSLEKSTVISRGHLLILPFIAPGVHEARWIAVKLERAMKATLCLSASVYALQST